MNGKNEDGFTLIEILVAMILVTLVGASVLMAFVNASRWADPSALAAVYDARGKLDQLNEAVRNDTWNLVTSPLNVGTHAYPDLVLNNRTYSQRQYVVTSVSLDGVTEAYRKVVATESWNY